MGRRSKSGGEPTKARRQTSAKRTRSNRSKPARRSTAVSPEAEVARLAESLHEALEQQTATSEVLRIISSSPGELDAVFQAILASATSLCHANYGTMWRCEGDAFRASAQYGALPAAYKERLGSGPFRLSPHLPAPLSIATRRPVQFADLRLGQAYSDRDPVAVAAVEIAGIRTILGVPMFGHRGPIGAIAIYRQEMRPFTERHIELVQHFADQAAIAVENTRLLGELRQRTSDLQDAVGTLERERENKLVNIEAIMASIAHEVRQPLSAIAISASTALRVLRGAPSDIGGVTTSLEMIKRDSGRASAIFDSIRSLFSRGEPKRQLVDVNGVALEVLRLLRSELEAHHITVETKFSSALPFVEADGGQMHQVIFNLIQNAIEAMRSTADQGRLLRIKTETHDRKSIVVALDDSGPGIDPGRLTSIFDAFVTTKAHGLGLGLAICRTIIEKHDGKLTASSDGRTGAQFQFILPVHYRAAESSRDDED